MSVWLAIPSARPGGGTIPAWRQRGYKIALWLDRFKGIEEDPYYTRAHAGPYPGYAKAVNSLASWILSHDPEADWIVTGGDDTLPDPNHSPEEIAAQLSAHFGGTFGVCQPTGDRFAQGSIDRIAGSPWLGREWCLRANQGQGPLYPDFTHMFVDEALMRTAEKLGVYLRRPDLVHLHRHFMRQSDDLHSPAVHKPVPGHLVRWNSPQHWDEMKAIFRGLEAQDFAPCMPLPAEVAA